MSSHVFDIVPQGLFDGHPRVLLYGFTCELFHGFPLGFPNGLLDGLPDGLPYWTLLWFC